MSHKEDMNVQESRPDNTELTSDSGGVCSRRLKKREVDRRCQRKARAKKQPHIQYSLVETLRLQNASGRDTTLLHQLQRTENERARLATTLGDIQFLLSHHEIQTDGAAHKSCTFVESRVNPNIDGDVPVQDDMLAPRASHPYEWIKPAQSCCCSAHVLRQSGRNAVWQGNYWKFIADVLDERFEWRADIQPADDDESEDALIRAMLEGWDAVEKGAPLHPSLQMMRRIDEASFGPVPLTERLAMLRAMHLQLQYHTDPSSQRYGKLPPWYTYRPLHHIPHTYAVDYWAWPHFRQRFISNEHVYCGNGFFHMYQEQMRILWPFEFRDCYTHDLETGLYELSRLFDERINNINCWTMGQDFFEKFPELSGVIPTNLRGVPKSMPAPGAVVMRKRRPPPPRTGVGSSRSTGFVVQDEDERERPISEQEVGARVPLSFTPASMEQQCQSRDIFTALSQYEQSSLILPELHHTYEATYPEVSSSDATWQDLWGAEPPFGDMRSSGNMSSLATPALPETDWLW